ncbi:MAG: cobalt-precorrin 5A hydrolase [Thermosediminibacteraceae bacterium]|nr:cobalt-precorrin 5A hydrolase [Thermosediminibacteraceae bacterium]PZN04934.1 MAG: cobalt-precorrin 5A hydrolase [Bacillota bacterium]
MKRAVIAVTERGGNLAAFIAEKLNADLYLPERYAKEKGLGGKKGKYPIVGEFVPFVEGIFDRYRALIFVSAVGIAVRAIAGAVKSKLSDPAVVVVDEGGNFCVSLLSGHFGGANELAKEVAGLIGATPVITTATDVAGIKAPDDMARKLELHVEKAGDLKKVNSCLLRGEKVVCAVGPDFPKKLIENSLSAQIVELNTIPRDAKAAVFVTDYEIEPPDIPHVVLRPRRIVLGIGCKKGADFSKLKSMMESFFLKLGLSVSGVGKIATLDIKKDEACIFKLSRCLGVPVDFFSVGELKKFESLFPKSGFVKEKIGVGSVARPAAFISSGKGVELGYISGGGFTLAAYRRVFHELD